LPACDGRGVLNPDLKETAMHNRSVATPRQLAYLRTLALRTGTTFSPPRTRGDASREIERLKALKASGGRHVELPREADAAERPYATAVHASEVSGFGSQARWRTSPPTVSGGAPSESRVGKLTELARYELASGQRILYGQRIDGCVRITDRPAGGSGRSYLVERGLERDGLRALNALVDDYLRIAGELNDVPMASNLVGLRLDETREQA
jgi:hypothetical protein